MTEKRLYSSLNTFVLITKALYLTSKYFFFSTVLPKSQTESIFLNYSFKFVSIPATRNSILVTKYCSGYMVTYIT